MQSRTYMKTQYYYITTLIVFITISIIGYIWYQNRNTEFVYSDEYCYQNEDLPYYQMEKQAVLKILPSPKIDYMSIVTNNSTFSWAGYVRKYHDILRETGDSLMTVNIVEWDLDNSKRPKLQIVFIEQDSLWIADQVIQWHPDKVLFSTSI